MTKTKQSTSKPKRKSAGRPKGSLNKTTRHIKYAAARYGDECIECLVRIIQRSNSDRNKIAAARELLDRGFGKATQAVTHASDPDQPLQLVFSWQGMPMMNQEDQPQQIEGQAKVIEDKCQ